METKLTIFTPTYNRAKNLITLYQSLLKQSDRRFLWLIVDDGSIDGTAELVDSWKTENEISITYIYQNNHGKHVAHNTGVSHTVTAYFYCVDSDDELPPGAVADINDALAGIDDRPDIAGLIAKKRCRNGPEMSSAFPAGITEASISELYRVYRLKGELAFVFKTEVMREFPFPVFGDEKFVTESVVLDQISVRYKMKLFDKAVYLADYMPDGYTSNLTRVHRNNPVGYHFYLLQSISLSTTRREAACARAAYICGCWKIRHRVELSWKDYIKNAPRAARLHAKRVLKDLLIKSALFLSVYRRLTGNGFMI